MDIFDLVKVSSRAWSFNIMAALAAGTPGRQATLLDATGAGRTAFSASLAHLIDIGLIERNPGHGHPLRPEFRLTARGTTVAAAALRITRLADDPSEAALIRRAWTMPILAVTGRPRYFCEIRQILGAVSDKTLSGALRGLEEREWLRRCVNIAGRPPRPTYEAVALGAQLHDAVGLTDVYC